jgi:hypothetical protein
MAWFTKMCRDVGLMIHNIRKPDHEPRRVRRTVDQQRQGNVTLRRTTIEEIEVNATGDERRNADRTH